jgi:hypothetical protein
MAPDFFANTKPRNVFDLRQLAEAAYPQLLSLKGQPHNAFATRLATELGLTYSAQDGDDDNLNSRKLSAQTLDRRLPLLSLFALSH